ncbi:IS200/IS605 family transposon protein TnpB [Halorubrum tebenquichense]|uniref:IS1341-type transposase (TCE32) n=1 Tax=Halorubrum tebenquichense DSM 14210 TaxID=1227485 RepID=M0DXF7_9EURY|nr:IS200/IS605 family transposon protein TnpB [Halorubrum tebenquichense]ELZ39407.1 IS1341-type transposase (TCE32) [Halorubrum tebenquichense DSM 14210]
MRRVNIFRVSPLSERDELILYEVLDASAALWNELTYHRRQHFFNNRDVWNVDADEYRVKYKGVLGSATAQQLIRKSDEAWRSFFALMEDGENPSPPGYWKDEDSGERTLQTLIRNDQYTLKWGERSRLEIPVGHDLKEKYGLGYHERLRLEARGNPRWEGSQGRLELVYDKDAEAFRARQPVSEATPRRDEPLAAAAGDDGVVAALDIGANNLVAVTTTTGYQRLYHARPQFHRFRRTTNQIAALQERLEYGTWSSRHIRQMYRRRTEHVRHLQDALVRDLAEWLAEHGVGEVIAGDLSDVLQEHWSARVNEKTHQFWSHGRFRRRLQEVLEGEYSIRVREVSEVGSSSTCPDCGSENIHREGDLLTCYDCGFEGHSDLAASENLLIVNDGSMARPAVSRENTTERAHRSVARLEWNDHRWRRRDHSTKAEPENQSTHGDAGKFASGGAGIA